jgi:glycosyltransferase involved in cell wall biosynthesis/SAM-dependent methyltransferase
LSCVNRAAGYALSRGKIGTSREIARRVNLIRSSPPADEPHLPFVSFANERAGRRVIDIGSGKGAHSLGLASEGRECLCVDLNVDFLKEARRRGLVTVRMDAHALALREHVFETALLFELIEHVRDPKQVLAEAKRVISKNILVTTPCHDYDEALSSLGLYVESCLPPQHLSFYRSADLEQLIQSEFPICRLFKGEPVFLRGLANPLYYSRLFAEGLIEVEKGETNAPVLVQPSPAVLEGINEITDLEQFAMHIERLHILEEERNKLAAEVAQKTNTINEQEGRLQILEDERNRLALEVTQKTNTINEQEAILRKLGSEHLALVARLDEIIHSLGYKFMRFWASRIDRLLPEDTRRGEFKKILVRSTRIATEQGLRSLLRLVREKIERRQFRVIGASVPDVAYALWVAKNEPTDTDLVVQQTRGKQFGYRPLISIITPVWNPPPDVLTDTIESVLLQTYDNWELCMADGGSQEAIRDVLRRFARRDRRVRVRFLDSNLGISGNSNMAIEWARGEFIALLDHDDMLAPFALFEVADSLNRMPELDFIYSDKDCIDLEGRRFNPLFKPDWSPDLMLSVNYVTHLCAIRTALVRSVGAFRSDTDGAQDWDLFLRVTEKTDKIYHISKVLYHWKLAPASVASGGLYAKPYAAKAQLLTLNQHLSRNLRQGELSFDDHGHVRAAWSLQHRPKISVVVHSGRIGGSLDRCLESIFRKSSYENFEVIVVCTETCTEVLQQFPDARFLESKHALDYSFANNLGASEGSGDILVFLDSSAEVLSTDWLQELAGWALQPEIGAVGAKLLHPSGEIVHGGVVVGLRGYVFEGAQEGSWLPFGDTEWYRDYSAVLGLCMATSRRVFEELGHFDERSGTPDIDFCIRARTRNYRVVYTPYAKLTIHHPRDLSPEPPIVPSTPEYRRLFETGDPYYNPNLSYEHSIPRLNVSQSPMTIEKPSQDG